MPAFLGFWFILTLILVPRNPGTSLLPMGEEHETFLGVFLAPSFRMVGNGIFVPVSFLVGFGGMKVGMSMVHLTLFWTSLQASVKLAPRKLVWIPLPHVQSWSRHCSKMMLPCMSRRVAPTLNTTGPKKEASFCKKPCLASMDPLCVCVYACSRSSCVDSIWLWVRNETFSKPVFGVSKTSISGFVAVGPHCIILYYRFTYIYILYTVYIWKKNASSKETDK